MTPIHIHTHKKNNFQYIAFAVMLAHGLAPLSVANDGLRRGQLHGGQAHRVADLSKVYAATIVGEAAAPLACVCVQKQIGMITHW